MSLLNYVPYVLSCPTCSRALRASCPTCCRALRALVPHVPPVLRVSCPTRSRALRALCPTCSRDPRASCLTCFSCPACSHAPRALRVLVPYVLSCLVPYVHSCPTYIVPYVLSCLTCFCVSLVLRALVPHVSYMLLYLTCLLPCIFLGCSWLGLYGTCAPEFWIVLSHYRVYSILQEIFNTESDLIMCFNSEWQESGN